MNITQPACNQILTSELAWVSAGGPTSRPVNNDYPIPTFRGKVRCISGSSSRPSSAHFGRKSKHIYGHESRGYSCMKADIRTYESGYTRTKEMLLVALIEKHAVDVTLRAAGRHHVVDAGSPAMERRFRSLRSGHHHPRAGPAGRRSQRSAPKRPAKRKTGAAAERPTARWTAPASARRPAA